MIKKEIEKRTSGNGVSVGATLQSFSELLESASLELLDFWKWPKNKAEKLPIFWKVVLWC